MDDKPKTIEEFKVWLDEHNLWDSDTTRFFVGVNYEKPKAFGIYRDGDNVILYKNKADGTRVIRYSGPDEEFAVSELYDRLMVEVDKQRYGTSESSRSSVVKRTKKSDTKPSVMMYWIGALVTIICTLFLFRCSSTTATYGGGSSYSYSSDDTSSYDDYDDDDDYDSDDDWDSGSDWSDIDWDSDW